jgi:hypothetical protein
MTNNYIDIFSEDTILEKHLNPKINLIIEDCFKMTKLNELNVL